MAGLSPVRLGLAEGEQAPRVNTVLLGRTGLRVPMLALGTGTHGWKFRSRQTELGERRFVELVRGAYQLGVRFVDMADIYGSHRYVASALKKVPRDEMVLLTKIWTRPTDWIGFDGVRPALERFRKEVGTDYFDIVLLHCQVSGDWPEELRKAKDELADAKAKGQVRAHGVSCHSLDALAAAAEDPWVDVILARINHAGARMDGPPSEVLRILKRAHENGKGVIGMKIFGRGELTSRNERERSLRFVLGSGCVDCMSIGFENLDQMRDTIRMIAGVVRD